MQRGAKHTRECGPTSEEVSEMCKGRCISRAARVAAAFLVIAVLAAPAIAANITYVYATGEGAMPTAKEEPNRAKAYLKAKSYAKMDAIANLIQSVKGVALKYRAEGTDYSATEWLSNEVDGIVDSVEVVSVTKRVEGNDGIVEVKVKAPLPSELTAASTASAAQVASTHIDPSWLKPAPGGPKAGSGKYTSVIIDTRGLGVMRSMSPRILTSDGKEVWGTVKVDPAFVQEQGIVAYCASIKEAFVNKRAGSRPLVIEAERRGSSPSKADVIIDRDDAEDMLRENLKSRFLDDLCVIFVVDPAPRRSK